MPECPNCKVDIYEIDYWEKGQIEFDGSLGKGWAFMQDREINFQCSNCHVPLDSADLDALGVPEDMRTEGGDN